MHRKSSKLLIFLVVFLDLLGFGIFIPMLPFFARYFGASATEIGLLMFVYSFIQIFLAPVWGRLSDRFGRRPILLITIGGQGLAFLLAALAKNYEVLLLSRILAGGFAGNLATATAYMADITSREERAKGMGIIGAAFGLGFVFGPAIGGVLIAYGYQWPSYAAACLSLINLCWAFMALGEPVVSVESRHANRRKIDLIVVSQVLSQKKFFYPILLFFLLTLAFVQLEITFGLFVLDQFHFSERTAGLLLAFLGIIMAIVQGGLIGRLTKRFGESRLIWIGMIFVMIGLGLLSKITTTDGLIAALIVLATGYSLTNPCLSAVTSKAADESEQGLVLGVYQSGGSMARVIGPITAGVVYDMNHRYPFITGVGIVVVAWLIWTVLRKK